MPRHLTILIPLLGLLLAPAAFAHRGPGFSDFSTASTYTYDNANNRIKRTITGGTNAGVTNYTYNAFNQLKQCIETTSDGIVETSNLTYDRAGNCTKIITTYNNKIYIDSDLYTYDSNNRLVSLTQIKSGQSKTYTYENDYRTRRIIRDESSAGGVKTYVNFSGGTSVQEYEGNALLPTLENIRGSDYGGGVGGLLYTIRGNIPSYTYENKRGDVIAKTDATGLLTYQASYEAFGTRTQEQGVTVDRQKANTKEEAPTGLLNEGRRYRLLKFGVFLNADPLGHVDGPNVYTYVRQNPWTSFDPEGLRSREELKTQFDATSATLESTKTCPYTSILGKIYWYTIERPQLLEAANAQIADAGRGSLARDAVDHLPLPAGTSESTKDSIATGLETGVTIAEAALPTAGAAAATNKKVLPGKGTTGSVMVPAGNKSPGKAQVQKNIVEKGAAAAKTEIVERVMSRAELQATQETGLIRGGREGVHHVTDAANSNAQRARQRLALDTTPEVKATMEVPQGKFSSPTKVQPANNMSGGGMERKVEGPIPAEVLKVKKLR